MKENRLRTIFVATIIAALLVIIITVCIIFIPSRPCVKIEAIQNLTTFQINNTLLATWSQPRGHGDCPMTYRIQLSKGAELIDEGFTMLPRFYFSNVSFAPCSPNTISVHAVTTPRFGGDIVGDTNTFTHFGNIGPVTNLQVLHESDSLTASWDPPMDSELCTLSYEVKLGAREEEPQITSSNSVTFDQFYSPPCEVYTVIVTPLGVEESLRGQEETRAHSVLGSVENFQLERAGQNTFLTSWEAPDRSEDCQLSYEVTLTFQGELVAQVVTQFLYHNFYVEGIRPCSLTNVTITPIATVGYDEEVRGSEIHRVHIEGLGPVVNLEITQRTNANPNGLLVGWDPPSASGFCTNISYEVVLQTRYGTVQERRFTLENQIVLERARLDPCVTNVVILTPLASISDGETVVKGEAFDRRHFGDVGPVKNLVVTQQGDGLVVNWMPPVVSEECPMFYKVNMWYNEDDITRVITDKLTYAFENAGLKPCVKSEVSVTPIVRKDLYESEGEEARGRHFGDIGPVANFELTLNADDQLVARWNAPIESELCELSYEMLLESPEEVTSKVFAQDYFEYVIAGADLRPCALNNVTLTPIAVVEFGIKRGAQDTRSHFAGVGPAEDLEMSLGEEGLMVEWMRPTLSELCQISYQVTLSFDDVVLDRIQTDAERHTFVEANLESCVENRVSVIPIGRNQGQETEGPEASRGHFADLGPVINFEVTQESNGLRASWGAPKNSDFCLDLSYEVVLKSSDETIVDERVILESELLFETAHLEPCAVSTVEVNPTAKMSDGETTVAGEKVAALHLADVGPVENLAVVPAEGGLAVNWAPPTVVEGCPLTYEVNLSYGGEVVETGVTDGLEQVFESVDLRPCVVSEVSVVPLVDLYERKGEETRERHVGEIGSVTNFELALDDNNQLTARWNSPIATDLCDLSYEVLLKSGGAAARQVSSQSLFEHVFTDANVRPCVLHEVTLTPVAMVEGNSVRGVEDLRTYFTELGPVENLEVTQQPNGLLAVWDPPGESESCIDVSYEVVLKTDGEVVLESHVVLENEYNFEEADLEPCAVNIITVIPTAKISDGETIVTGDDVTNLHLAGIGPVENLALAQAEEDLVVNWAPPTVTESCPLTYEVNLWYNGEVIETTTTDSLEHVFENAGVRPCMVVEVSVAPLVDLYERRGEEIRERYVGEIGSVTNFELTLDDSNQLTARWNAPIDSDLCDMSYEIVLDPSASLTRQVFNEDHYEHVFSEADLRPCLLNTVTLTPVANVEDDSVRGVEDLRTYFTGLGPVVNLEVTQQPDGLLAGWDPPGESEFCIDVSYEIVLKTYDDIVLENLVVPANEYNFEEAGLEPCSLNIITVTPMAKISDGETMVRGEDVTDIHFTDIGPVENLLLVQAEGGLAVNWAPPTVTESCPLTYEVKLLRNDEIIETDVTDASEHVFENVNLAPCVVTHVSVTPLVDLYDRRGEEMRDQHVGEIGSVTNFELTLDDGNQLAARWNAPIDSDLCDMSYEIVLGSGDPEMVLGSGDPESLASYVFSEANLLPCILNTVTLTPVANVEGDSVRGVEDLRTYFTGLGPVANLEVTQQPNGLLARWDPPGESESCIDVSYEVVLKSYDDVVLENLAVVGSEYNFEEANLGPCSLNIITVTPVAKISDGETLVRGGEVTNVHFADIGPVENLMLVQAEGGLTVNWAPPAVTESCPLTYEVKLLHDDEIIETDVTDASEHVFENADLTPCLVTEVSVVPLVDLYERRGEEIRKRHIGEIGSVTDFELVLNDFNQLTARWNAPIATERCELSYEVLVDSDEGATRLVFENRYFEYVLTDANVRPCVLNTVTLTPIADVEGDSVRGIEDLRTYFTGLGPVVNLEVAQEPNGLLASWDPPDDSEFCVDVSYEVVLKTDDETVLESRVVVGDEYNFEEADLEPCALSIITITATAKITDGETVVTGEGVTNVHIADIGSVRNLVVDRAGEGLAVNWEAPTVSENCPLTYEVDLWYNGDVAETTATDNLGHAFESADVRPCVVADVSVVPVARRDSHESKGEETRGRHIGEIGSITNFELLTLDQDHQLVARWNAPVQSELCDLSYEILLESTEGEPSQVFTESQLEHVFGDAEPRPCVAYTVTITPIAILEGGPGPVRGLQDTLAHVEDIGPVENLEVNQSGESLLVTWARPTRTGLCQVFYDVILSFGEEVLDHVQTDIEEHIFVQANLRPCTENHVSVIPMGYNQDLTTQGPETNQRLFATIGPVQDLIFQAEPFGISWVEPAYSEACVLSYHVQIDSENYIVTDNFYPLEDVACHQYTATVTALAQEGQSGPPQTETHQVPSVTEIGPVQTLRFSENAFEWDPPMNTGECEVTYELTVTINDESTFLTTKERIYEVLSLCSTAAIVVVASVEDIAGEPAGLEVEVPLLSLGPVENLEFRSDRVRWQRPSGSGGCPIVYKLTHTSGAETHEVTLPESQSYFLIDLKFCSHHEVRVYAFYEENGIAGDPVSIEKTIPLPSDPAAIGRVKGLTLASEVRVEWQPPDSVDTELCSVVYSVTLDRGFDMKTYSQEETHFDIPEVPCSDNVLSVFPIVNGVLGQVADISSVLSENAMVDIAPDLISFTTDSTSVSSIWRAFSREINACKITNFTVELVLDEPRRFVVPVTDNDQRIISVEVDELLPDTEYSMRTGIHIHEFPMHGPLSEAFTFRTEPLRSKQETKGFISKTGTGDSKRPPQGTRIHSVAGL